MLPSRFRGYLVERSPDGTVGGRVQELEFDRLPPGEVVIRTAFSSVNYKDGLATQGHPGVVRSLPHVPGVDAAGTVIESGDARWKPGDEVIVTGNELGSGRWGGWAEMIRVPGDWVVARPQALSLFESMILGTAGFTAAQCVLAIERCGIQPDAGEVLVTGATGGVGSLAVKLLAARGYHVVASTGKADQAEHLKHWGAARVIDRAAVSSDSPKPLLSAKWAAAVDTVGGKTLDTIVRETKPYGCVTACGLVAGADLQLTVHPFLLRGVILNGIASALLPYDQRMEIWRRLAEEWRITDLQQLAVTIPLEEVPAAAAKILRGEVVGRTVVKL